MPALSSAALRKTEFQKILLIKLSALGDVVHSIPVVSKLRRRFPSAQIDWLVRPAFAGLVEHHPAVSNVLALPRQCWSRQWPQLLGPVGLLSRLRSRRYDLVIDLQGQLRSAVLTLATGAPVRIGFDRPRAEIWRASQRLGSPARSKTSPYAPSLSHTCPIGNLVRLASGRESGDAVVRCGTFAD
jgi:ADP-heptose:LPS heptosyltransferase